MSDDKDDSMDDWAAAMEEAGTPMEESTAGSALQAVQNPHRAHPSPISSTLNLYTWNAVQTVSRRFGLPALKTAGVCAR